ncbi:MAG TPA: alpha/beta hydrolase [Ilumatobacter sp.]|nr:alpha/beta hydrolase [Ilumatobacter sp.]
MVDHYPPDITRVGSSDAQIAVHVLAGDPSRPPLLISHATGFHAHAYLPVAQRLADRFHVFGIDHRGHGATASPGGNTIDWTDCGADTAAVARSIAPDGGLVGVGHSMGGATLLLAAHRDPQLFSRLILFEPIAFPPSEDANAAKGSPLATGALRRRRRFDSYDHAYDNYASKPPLNQFDADALRNYVDFGFAPIDDHDGVGVQLRCTPEMESATFVASMESGLWDLLPHIATAVIVIGSGDGDGPALIAPRVAERLPNAEFVSFPDQNHFGPFVDPGAFADTV